MGSPVGGIIRKKITTKKNCPREHLILPNWPLFWVSRVQLNKYLLTQNVFLFAGDSFDNNISDLLSLNMPRGSLLGNTNPIGTCFNANTSFDSNSPVQVIVLLIF